MNDLANQEVVPSLTDDEVEQCFDYISNSRMSYEAVCQHFRPGGHPLIAHLRMAVSFAKNDWDHHFGGKEPAPKWRHTDFAFFYEQLVDLVMERKDQFK